MLLAIDVGNTNIVLGRVRRRAARRELAPRHASRADIRRDRDLGRVSSSSTARSIRTRLPGIVMGSVVPPLTSTFITMAQRFFGMRPVECGQQRRYRHADSVQEPRGGRRQSHSQWRRRLPPVRPGAPHADDRGRLRHRHDLRCHFGKRGVPGRHHHTRACRFPPTRCFNARRGCRVST